MMLGGNTGGYVVVAGCLGQVAACGYLLAGRTTLLGGDLLRPVLAWLLLCWTPAALITGSPAVGFGVIAVLLLFVGVVVLPWIGPLADGITPIAMLVSGALVIAMQSVAIVAPDAAWVADVFGPGTTALGLPVVLGGALIRASRHYGFNGARWAAEQVFALFLGAIVVVWGSLHDPTMLEAAGTFFFGYILTKFADVDWQRSSTAWLLLTLSLTLFAMAGFAESHPDWFVGFS